MPPPAISLARTQLRPHTACMSNLDELLILLGLAALVGFWLKQSGARERATRVARAQCERYGLQLLDETVGLRAWRLRRRDGRLGLERGYGFELSIDGADRASGMLWMHEQALIELHLPTVVLIPDGGVPAMHQRRSTDLPPVVIGAPPPPATLPPPAAHDNVIPLRPRRRSGDDRPV